MNAQIVKEVTQLKNAQLGRLLVSLCEWTTHYPAQCHIYPMVQRTIQLKEEAMKGALMEGLEEPVMKKEVEDTPKEEPIKPYTKSCYSCGEEGHISQNCLNGDLVEFPTEEVEYDPHELEAMNGMKGPGREVDWIPGRT